MVVIYSEKREALTSMLRAEFLEGSMAISNLDNATVKKVLPLTVPPRMLIEAMMDQSAKDYDQAKRTFQFLKEYCEKCFGADFPQMEIEDQPPPA